MSDAIRLDNLMKRFGDLTAVDGLSFAVTEGEIFGLVGPDGAGKTTTMRLLSAIMDPSGGDATVADCHIVAQAEALKEQIGYMSQRFGLYSDLTVLENLNFYADIYNVPRRGRQPRIDRLLGFSNLTPFKRRLAGNLSGGMKQKLGLACALVHTPRVLLLDEPTNGVDPVSRRDFWRILYQLLRDHVTIFISTAYLDEAERCNRLALIHRGRLLACGTPDEVKRLMRGALLEIRCEEPRRAAAALRGHFGHGAVGLFGDRVHLAAKQGPAAADEAARLLRAAGIDAPAIRPIEPSLEDVFVSVLADVEAQSDTAARELAETAPNKTAPNEAAAAGAGAPPDGATHEGLLREFAAAGGEPPTASLAPDAPAVVVRGLEKRFGSFAAVNDVSFEVRRGEIFGFLGPNGAGKSTTIRMLCGILAPSGGSGSVAGYDIRRQAEQIKSRIGYMSQKFSLYQDLTVEENIDFYSGIYCIPPERKRERKEWVLRMAGLEDHRHRPAGVLSGGWKQRLALGCAVLHQPPIIFLDEPTSGVDPVSRRQFWDLIYALAGQGVTTFVTTHYMDEAEYCDRLALIYRGELIAVGTPATLKQESMQEDVLEVVCDEAEAMIDPIERLPSVKEAALFGRGLHVVASDGGRAAIEIHQLLESAGRRTTRIEKIVPSLEDVFVSLIEARDRAGGKQAEVRG